MYMGGQQRGNPIGEFGQQQRVPVLRRALQSTGPLIRLGIAGGIALSVLVYVDPDHKFLSALGGAIGAFGGGIIAGEQAATRESSSKNTEANADAAARAEAKKGEQLLAAESAQRMRDAALLPDVADTIITKGMCLLGKYTSDRAKELYYCPQVAGKDEALTHRQAGAIDTLGNARQWNGAPAAQAVAPVPAVQDPPWTKAEQDRLFRLRVYASRQALDACEAGNRDGSGAAKRRQSECLAVMAGEGPDGPTPGTIRDANASAPRVIPPNSVLAR